MPTVSPGAACQPGYAVSLVACHPSLHRAEHQAMVFGHLGQGHPLFQGRLDEAVARQGHGPFLLSQRGQRRWDRFIAHPRPFRVPQQ